MILNTNEIKQGWTEATLKKHLKDMERDTAMLIYGQRKKPRPRIQNNEYRPLHWRR